MPNPLGGKAHSDHHAQRPHASEVRPAWYGPQPGPSDRPDPKSAYEVPNTHNLFVPPGMAPAAVGDAPVDVTGPRHSALGLEGIESVGGKTKTPTVRNDHRQSSYH